MIKRDDTSDNKILLLEGVINHIHEKKKIMLGVGREPETSEMSD
ncbi:24103_t:CDS:2 [Gigaspora rosea]|nr:24103_t:CDS:2 [Gigaspora rosea]